MDLFEAVAKRHSYRGPFTDQPVPKDDLRKIVQAGLQAPSGLNEQTTTFVIIDNPGKVKTIRSLHPRNLAMQQAQAYICCVVDQNPQNVYEQFSFQVEDCAAAVENMLLAITALGYATVWIDGWLRVERHAQKIGEAIDLPAEKALRVILPIGVPEESWPQKEKHAFEKRAWFNKYG